MAQVSHAILQSHMIRHLKTAINSIFVCQHHAHIAYLLQLLYFTTTGPL